MLQHSPMLPRVSSPHLMLDRHCPFLIFHLFPDRAYLSTSVKIKQHQVPTLLTLALVPDSDMMYKPCHDEEEDESWYIQHILRMCAARQATGVTQSGFYDRSALYSATQQ